MDEAVQADAIPDLALALGTRGPIETLHAATTEYRDPTIHDVLGPIPSFAAPELRAPSFELFAPRIGRDGVPYPPPTDVDDGEGIQDSELLPEAFRSPSADAVVDALLNDEVHDAQSGLEGDGKGDGKGVGKVDALHYWDLLSQIGSHDVAQNSYKSTFRETREELVQRLLDPPLTLEETARLLGVCPTTVRRYTNKGNLRHFRTTGNQRRFRLSDVLEFLESRESEIAADAQADREAGHEG